jgi:hypothetical protein
VQVRRDDADAKCLRRFLVASMALLLAKVGGGNTLHMIQDIEQGIAEELREHQRADDDATSACAQAFYLRRIWHWTLLQTVSGGIKNGLGTLRHKQCPRLAFNEAIQGSTDAPTDVALEQVYPFAQRGRSKFAARLLDGRQVKISKYNLIRSASEIVQGNFSAGTCAQDEGAL